MSWSVSFEGGRRKKMPGIDSEIRAVLCRAIRVFLCSAFEKSLNDIMVYFFGFDQ
jgi:hypothetical protein